MANRPTYEELQAQIKQANKNITNVNERISNADSAYELGQLAAELDHYEMQLLLADEVLMDTINKGRGD